MDTDRQRADRNRCNPRQNANFLSVLFFGYTFNMFWKGCRKTLDMDDVYDPIECDRSQVLSDRLERKWLDHESHRRKQARRPQFLLALVHTFWPEYLSMGVVLFLMEVVVKLLQPVMLGKLLQYFSQGVVTVADEDGVLARSVDVSLTSYNMSLPVSNLSLSHHMAASLLNDSTTINEDPTSTNFITRNEALYYASMTVFLNGITALFLNQYLMNAFHYGMRVRAACCALIYRKSLKLSKSALTTSAGQIVNLLSNDVSRFDIVSVFVHHMWIAPLSSAIVTYMLYREAGVAALIGMVPVLFVLPIQSYTGKLSATYRKRTAMKTDERVRLMDEIIGGIQVIKMYAWERPFTRLAQLARKMELQIVTKSSYVRGLYMTFNMFTTRMALFCTLVTMALSGQQITAAKVFVFMSYYNIVSQTLTSMFVRGLSEMAELFVAIKRIEAFLLNVEQKPLAPPSVTSATHNNRIMLELRNVTANWIAGQHPSTLVNVDLVVKRHQLVAVIGAVGSGKSSLLHTILGEMVISNGKVLTYGSVSYASQEPWVFVSTIRQNILFGSEYDRKRYNQVVHACALEADFKQFPFGDLTMVGERGAALSGGQKARINLARAVYRDTDIYLLDDPLSAVDVHVGKHLYEHCINGFLKRKTRVLVTHQVHLLKSVTHILLLDEGKIVQSGAYDIVTQDPSILRLEEGMELNTQSLVIEEKDDNVIRRRSSLRRVSSCNTAGSELSIPDSIANESIMMGIIADMTIDDYANDDDKCTVTNEADVAAAEIHYEKSSKGTVSGSLLWRYLLAGGNVICVGVVLLLFVLAQAFASGVDYFVSWWSKVEEMRVVVSEEELDEQILTGSDHQWWMHFWQDRYTLIYVYSGLMAGLFVVALSRSMAFYKLAMRSSRNLHNRIFDNVISAPMRFFDTNPSGRILNRFAKDMGSVDEMLPKAMVDAAQMLLTVAGSLVLVTFVNPYFLVMVSVIAVAFLFLRFVLLKSSKNIKRLEGMLRGPVFTHLNATLQGLTTIRAYGAEASLRAEFDSKQDLHTGAWFMFIAASSAFGFYLDLVCFIFVTLVTFSFFVFTFGLSGSDVGLAITQATALTGVVQWGIRQSAEVTNNLMSVERLLEYKNLPQEQQKTEQSSMVEGWPLHGSVQFENVSLSYDAKQWVLHQLNVNIEAGHKVGIVGRTGAGKSSLISALFRMAPLDGTIRIDGVDTATVPLHILRSHISIIPQDPVLFSGTLRYNLDPFEEYDDHVLYKALTDVELRESQLVDRVQDRGANYSVGQRQLICLARALVRNNRVLLLDEATANVDPHTDTLIQRTIREKFSECTVLTVAHRLNTIMDSDRVMVMDNGNMVEFDHPFRLLQDCESYFFRMASEAGKLSEFEEIAKCAFDRSKTKIIF